jgi:hypothetical protein
MRQERFGSALALVTGLLGTDKAEAEKVLPTDQLHALRAHLCSRLGWASVAASLAKRRLLDFPVKPQLF